MFNPTNPAVACNAGTPPLPHGADYQYQHTGYVHARRRKRQAGEDDGTDCVPRDDTEHCVMSKSFRENEVRESQCDIFALITENLNIVEGENLDKLL